MLVVEVGTIVVVVVEHIAEVAEPGLVAFEYNLVAEGIAVAVEGGVAVVLRVGSEIHERDSSPSIDPVVPCVAGAAT